MQLHEVDLLELASNLSLRIFLLVATHNHASVQVHSALTCQEPFVVVQVKGAESLLENSGQRMSAFSWLTD